jgi:tetratricopeptide (TPR) repeat protein
LGVPAPTHPQDTETQISLLRSLLADRQMLIVLDNAANSDHVLPLLPGGSRCAVLVTSRTMLGALTVRGASPLPLKVLGDDEAETFLSTRLAPHRSVEQREMSLAPLLTHCGGLPLALSIVAARASMQPERPLDALAEELDNDVTRLDALSVGEVGGDLRRVLSWSYDALNTDTARAFRLLSLAPGADISVLAAAALLNVNRPAARDALQQLTAAHLLHEHAGRYRMHDLVRLFATELSSAADAPDARSSAVKHVCAWYLRQADHADRILAPNRTHVLAEDAGLDTDLTIDSYEDAMSWYGTERGNLGAAVHAAAAHGHHELAWQLSLAAFGYYRISQYWREWLDMQEAALSAARASQSEHADAWVLNALGIAYTIVHRDSDATAVFHKSLAIRRRIGDRRGEGQVLNNLSELARRTGLYREAIDYALQDQVICVELGDTYGEAICLNNLGKALLHANRTEDALSAQRQALQLCQAIGERQVMAEIQYDLGEVYHHLDQHDDAVRNYQAAIETGQAVGDLLVTTSALLGIAEVMSTRGDLAAARHHADQAESLFAALSAKAPIADIEQRLRNLRRDFRTE